MSVIEMAGMVGAGKTTMASALRADLDRRGLQVLDPERAITEIMGRSPVGAAAARLLRNRDARRWVLRRIYKLAVRPSSMLGFVARHPTLIMSAAHAMLRSPLPIWHRRRIVALFLRPAAAVRYIGPRLRPHEVLLLEEGLVHRAVNLFAWIPNGVDRATVARYVTALPRTDLVVLVDAPVVVCQERARSRGLPRRLLGRDEATIARFMRNAAEIIDLIPDALDRAGRPWALIDNSGAPGAAVAALRRAVDARLPVGRPVPDHGGLPRTDSPAATAATTPRFAGAHRLPRPRPAARVLRRQPPGLPADRIAAALAVFNLRAVGPVAAVPGTSRGDNVVVQTTAGVKLLKRYKASVTGPAILHEHSILRHLEAIGFPAPRLTTAPGGSTAAAVDERWYAVFDYLPGYVHIHDQLWLPKTQRRLVELSGEALAALHAALDGCTPEGANPTGFASRDGERWRDIEWYLQGLERAHRYGSHGSTDTARVRRMLDEHAGPLEKDLRALDARLAAAELPRQVIHGDFGPYNLLFARDKRIVVLDFELSRLDWRLVDVVKALQQFGVNRLGMRPARLAALVAGYERRSPLEAREHQLLPETWLFLTLRRIVVCWDRHAASGDHRWLAEAQRKLALAEMIRTAAATLITLGRRDRGTR